ncbi:hypothetical protein, partial [Bacillus sp. AFS055030]|uniref:hypothetical protein n=1 Tax=Bacillus sp. AFS055030 TaxID=2033507 RepID=UPI000C035315
HEEVNQQKLECSLLMTGFSGNQPKIGVVDKLIFQHSKVASAAFSRIIFSAVKKYLLRDDLKGYFFML